MEQCGGTLWQLGQRLCPGWGRWASRGRSGQGVRVWWRDPRPGREQGHPPSGASPPGKGMAKQEQLRSESPGSSRCTAGSPLASHGPRQPRPVPWPGAREGRAWQGNPEHHTGQGPRTCWPFLGRLRDQEAQGDWIILGPPVRTPPRPRLPPPGNALLKLHCCSFFGARVAKPRGSVPPPLPAARAGYLGVVRRPCSETTAQLLSASPSG